MSGICFSEVNKKQLFINSVKKAESYYSQGEYQRIIEVLKPFQVYVADFPVDRYYKALTLRGNSYININQFLDGMSDFREINGMSVNQEPYPIYMCELFEALCGHYKEAKGFNSNLPAIYVNIPDYYLVGDYLLAFLMSDNRDRIFKEIVRVTNLPFYQKSSSEFWGQLKLFVNGKIDYQQLLNVTPQTEIISINLLAGLRLEKMEGSFYKAQQYYFDVYNSSSDLYHWLAGKQLGLNYLFNLPLIIKDGKVQQREKNYKFVASSALYDDNQKYPVENIFDNNPNSAWVKGKPGDGIGEWIEVGFEPEFNLSQIKIINGYAKSKEIYSANNRVKKVVVNFSNGKPQEFILQDNILGFQTLKLPKPVKVDSLKITIKDIYQGTKYNDTCISEIQFF